MTKLLQGQKTKKIDVMDMGKKHLAYEINKVKEGNYLLLTIEAEPMDMNAFEQQVKLHPEVIRYLLTRKN